MNLGESESESKEEESAVAEVHFPSDIDWQKLDESKFFFLGAALFSGVSATLYPIVVLKTRQQLAQCQVSCIRIAFSLIRLEGFRALYRGFGTSLMGTIPARALYMASLEITKSSVVGTATVGFGLPEPAASTIANAVAGLSAAVATQLVWTPVDVVSQRLMAQGSSDKSQLYTNGIDAFRKILKSDGPRGLYRGFGVSILTYAPSNAVWWASYSMAQRVVWKSWGGELKADSKTVMAVQGVSAAMAGGVFALITMPLDTIKTRLQVLEGHGGRDENGRRGCGGPTVVQTMKNLVKEGGWMACYRGLGPRWASMSVSTTTMITTHEFLK